MNLPPEWLRNAYDVFKQFAVKFSARTSAVKAGVLKPDSFRLVIAILAEMDPEDLEQEAIADAFTQADADGNKSIDFLEFASWLMKHSFDEFLVADNREERQLNRHLAVKLDMSLQQVEKYREKFSHFDADGSGTIDKEEFLQLLSTSMKVKRDDLPASRVHQWWRAADLDSNGHIDFEEFIKFHRKYFGLGISGTTNLEDYYRVGAMGPNSFLTAPAQQSKRSWSRDRGI